MTNTDWYTITTLMAQLWPDWSPTSAQSQEWRSALDRHPVALIDRCVRDAFRESRWREPRMPDVLVRVRDATQVHRSKLPALHAANEQHQAQYEHEERIELLSCLEDVELDRCLNVVGELWPSWREPDDRTNPATWDRFTTGMTWAAHTMPHVRRKGMIVDVQA